MPGATEKGKKVGIQTYPNAHAGGEYRPTKGTKLILHKGTKPYTPEGKKVGKRIELKKGGRTKAQFGYNSGRTNLLDESRRIRSEPQTRNVLAEEARVGGELSAGFKKGGKIIMTKDWQKGSGFVKEPKVTRDVGKNKDGYGQAETIETPNTQESTTVTVKGTKTRKPVKATWF